MKDDVDYFIYRFKPKGSAVIEEHQATHEQLVQKLQNFEVSARDQVMSEGRWMTFATSPDFFETCEGLERSHQKAHHSDSVRKGLLFIGIALLLLVLRLMLS